MSYQVDKEEYDFYRCVKCQRLITMLEERRILSNTINKAKDGIVTMCACGASRYSPTNPRWFEFLFPRVLWFAFQRIRGVA